MLEKRRGCQSRRDFFCPAPLARRFLNRSTLNRPDTYPLRHALLAQLGGFALVALLIVAMRRYSPADPAAVALGFAMLQGGIAAIIAHRQEAPLWWLAIHLGFAPLLLLASRFDIAPGWFLAGFLFLLLLFWRTDKSRVPLFLSNRQTSDALVSLLPSEPCHVLDAGCGDGGLLRRLARARPDCEFVGIEHAPLPWLLAKLRTVGLANVTVRLGDFWFEPFGDYSVVYAFLSPAPMPRLWQKARAELRPHARLVSNSFAVPDVPPFRTVRVADRRGTRLFVYLPDKAPDSAVFPAIPDDSARQ